MRIRLNTVFVEEQDHALRFYTEVLGFRKKQEIPVGEFRWLTVVSPEGPDDVELSLEPNAHPAARAFQEALREDGIPATAFEVDDLRSEHRRLKAQGVTFTVDPTETGPVLVAVFADTCGNLIQLYEVQDA